MIKKFIPASFHYRLALLKRSLFGYTKYSQFGEDEVLATLFKDKTKGFYVDVGAHHPERYSNTYLLHKKGWHGINIDPNPDTIRLFKKERPDDVNLECGVGHEGGEMTYYQFSDPAVNSFVKEEAEKWKQKKFLTYLGERKVPVKTLSSIFDSYRKSGAIDLLTIDAEGMDLTVLQSNNWDAYRPTIIVVEGEDSTPFLESKGYTLHTVCGVSRIFV